uniref:BTB domain-containing protein n=1 Tax=Meloidogyne javanica TaxID=6303 RepID=A0A915ND48_MELJA
MNKPCGEVNFIYYKGGSKYMTDDSNPCFVGNQISIRRFPEVGWELVIEIDKCKNIDDTVGIWLRQVGPCATNGLVNTKYKIYAIMNKYGNPPNSPTLRFPPPTSRSLPRSKTHAHMLISRSTNKLEDQQKMGYSKVSLKDIIIPKEEDADASKIIEDDKKFTDCTFKGEVIISDTTPECLRALLEYFYTGKINKNALENNVEGIFALAHKYQVETLQYECECCMANLLNAERFLKYCKIISLYGATTLEIACKDYCLVNEETFLNSKKWEKVKEEYPHLAIKCLAFINNGGMYEDYYESICPDKDLCRCTITYKKK